MEQRSEEWFEARNLRMTASNAQCIAAADKGLNTYVIQLCAEHLSSGERESFSNSHTERGNKFEDEARSIYELETGQSVEQVGFVEFGKYAGASPDGLCGDDGLVEFKSPADKEHVRTILKGIQSEYVWQMQMQLLVTGRKWCDFVSYNPNFPQSLYIERIFPDTEKQEKILAGLKVGEELIKNTLKQLEKVNAK